MPAELDPVSEAIGRLDAMAQASAQSTAELKATVAALQRTVGALEGSRRLGIGILIGVSLVSGSAGGALGKLLPFLGR